MFSEQGDKTPIKTDATVDPAPQNASVAVSLEFYIHNSFKAAGRDSIALQTILAKTPDEPCALPLHKDWTTNVMTDSPRS